MWGFTSLISEFYCYGCFYFDFLLGTNYKVLLELSSAFGLKIFEVTRFLSSISNASISTSYEEELEESSELDPQQSSKHLQKSYALLIINKANPKPKTSPEIDSPRIIVS